MYTRLPNIFIEYIGSHLNYPDSVEVAFKIRTSNIVCNGDNGRVGTRDTVIGTEQTIKI